jgi:hypothetical protein
MAYENVKLGDLPAKRVDRIIDDTAERFGKLCEDCFRKAAREIARPDMDVKTLVMSSVARVVSNKAREPLGVVKEEGESEGSGTHDPGPTEPEPSFAIYLNEGGDMEADAST